jgi:predicted GNAT superfamily acetyltransferase
MEMIRDAVPADFADIVHINAESEHFLSPLSPQRLEILHSQAAYHRVAWAEGGTLAFLLAFREGAAYDSPNYLWFASRYSRFLYIDRVVVRHEARAMRLGTLLYNDLLMFARSAGLPRVTCEFDIHPPNPVSAAFHRKFGFVEVGQQGVAGGKKTVSLQEVLL